MLCVSAGARHLCSLVLPGWVCAAAVGAGPAETLPVEDVDPSPPLPPSREACGHCLFLLATFSFVRPGVSDEIGRVQGRMAID